MLQNISLTTKKISYQGRKARNLTYRLLESGEIFLDIKMNNMNFLFRRESLDIMDAVKMNQLQNLLHDALISTDHVQHCAIIRRKDCNIRASSVGFNLHQEQVQILLDAFKNPPQTREEGIYFDDRQYKCVRADKNSIYGKCDKRGLILVRTQSMLLISTYSENMFPSVCVEAVEKLADYFKEKGK